MSELRPFEECPRYATCSVNICPLDPEQDIRTVHKLDKEQKCPMEKTVRARIGSQYPDTLPRLGLTRSEWASKQVYLKKSAVEKQTMAQRGRQALEDLRRQNEQDGNKSTL